MLTRLAQVLGLARAGNVEPIPEIHQRTTMVFVHIPKTGGLSLRQTLLGSCTVGTTFRIIHQVDDAARFAALPLERRRAMELVEGHMYYGLHEYLPRPCTYITLVREPVARVRSFYRYVCQSRWHFLYPRIAAEGMTLRDCIERKLTVELDNYMTRSLTSLDYVHVPFGGVNDEMFAIAKAHLDSIALVGTTDNMSLLYAMLTTVLGFPVAQIPHINKSAPSFEERDGAAALNDLVLSHNHYDRLLYEYAVSLIKRRAHSWGLADHGQDGLTGGRSVVVEPGGSISELTA